MTDRPKPKGSPLTPHRNGQWCKKIRGKIHYFGTDHDAALAEYRRLAHDLHAGRVVADTDPTTITVAQLCNRFLAAKEAQRQAGELAGSTAAEYGRAAVRLVAVLGSTRPVSDVRPGDFARVREAMSETLGASSIATHTRMTRTIFRWAWEHELIDRPVRYGSSFAPPPASAIRRQLALKPRTFTAAQINAMLGAVTGPLEAFVLLGINAGLGAADCAAMRADHLRGDLLDFPRVKTGIQRRAVLWPRTVDAIQRHANGDDLLFVTSQRNPWVRSREVIADGSVVRTVRIDSIGMLFNRLGYSPPGFYGLRRTFRTVADECGDQHAVHLVMGHVVTGMAGIYVDRISDVRLRAVAEHVESWLKSG